MELDYIYIFDELMTLCCIWEWRWVFLHFLNLVLYTPTYMYYFTVGIVTGWLDEIPCMSLVWNHHSQLSSSSDSPVLALPRPASPPPSTNEHDICRALPAVIANGSSVQASHVSAFSAEFLRVSLDQDQNLEVSICTQHQCNMPGASTDQRSIAISQSCCRG